MDPEEAEQTGGQVSAEDDGAGTTEDLDKVSGRFLSDFFRALERKGLPASELLGDLPVALGERGDVTEPVEWDHFVEFMRRLARSLGSPSEVERCGETIGDLEPARLLAGLAGLAASPHVLYRAASGWVLRRARPGVKTRLTRTEDGQLEIHAWIAEGRARRPSRSGRSRCRGADHLRCARGSRGVRRRRASPGPRRPASRVAAPSPRRRGRA